jgi:FtsP/CotA-like multicopper oxidase with cupredoxin domain
MLDVDVGHTRSCVPPKVAAAAFPANFSALPSGVFTGCVPSNGGEEVIMVDPANKYARFDLIGVGQLAMTFSIDEHPMTVVAIDGRWVSPTPADAITINSGQRYSVVVRLDRPAGNYTIRSVSGDIAQIIQATGTLAYTGGGGPKHCSASMSKPFVTLGGTNATADTVFLNESLATPFPPVQPSSSINATYVLNIDNAGKAWKWRLGNQSFPMNLDEDNPLLFNPTPQGNLTIANLNGSWIDLVVQPLPATSPAHPIHKHSNKFFVVGHGVGIWNYSSVAQAAAVSPGSFNFIDPPIRDTYPTQAAFGTPTWLVLRYHSENPGAFLLHCHIQGHLYGGMALALLDGVDKFPTVPDEYRFGNGFQNCIAKT